MLRPVSYFYEQGAGNHPEAILAPSGTGTPVSYTLQGMGNPLLWWFATAAVVALAAAWVSCSLGWRRVSLCKNRHLQLKDRHSQRLLHLNPMGYSHPHEVEIAPPRTDLSLRKQDNGARPVVSFVVVNYAANWLPWMLVSRCTFLYHALGMMVFAALGLAWLISRWLFDYRWHYRVAAWMVLLLVLWGFIFWLPVFIGLPLSPGALKQRWWLQSWI
jgi:dolichyl-phosphate-mannose-protein mannosyltransferase